MPYGRDSSLFLDQLEDLGFWHDISPSTVSFTDHDNDIDNVAFMSDSINATFDTHSNGANLDNNLDHFLNNDLGNIQMFNTAFSSEAQWILDRDTEETSISRTTEAISQINPAHEHRFDFALNMPPHEPRPEYWFNGVPMDLSLAGSHPTTVAHLKRTASRTRQSEYFALALSDRQPVEILSGLSKTTSNLHGYRDPALDSGRLQATDDIAPSSTTTPDDVSPIPDVDVDLFHAGKPILTPQEFRDVVEDLYIKDGHTLTQVMAILRARYDDIPSDRTLKRRLAEWGLYKVAHTRLRTDESVSGR